MKNVLIRSFSGPYFPVFEYRKIRTRKNFPRSDYFKDAFVAISVPLTIRTTPLASERDMFPVDTGRKLNVHKKFRKRPGCFLNVLCTFNLRPVSTGLF